MVEVKLWRALLAVVLTCALLGSAAACGGSAGDGGPSAESSSPSAPAGSLSESAAPGAATSVRLLVTGGLAGVRREYVVRRGDGFAEVLALAAAPEVREYAGEHLSHEIADAFVYRLTIRYPGGSEVEVVTDDGSRAPQQVRRLISLLQDRVASTGP